MQLTAVAVLSLCLEFVLATVAAGGPAATGGVSAVLWQYRREPAKFSYRLSAVNARPLDVRDCAPSGRLCPDCGDNFLEKPETLGMDPARNA